MTPSAPSRRSRLLGSDSRASGSVGYLIEAEILADDDADAALKALMRAKELNPLDEDIAALEKSLLERRRGPDGEQ